MSGLGSVGTFVVVTFFIASFGPAQVAGHAIALQSANVGFALLWGGAQATTIRMGWATGARNQAATEVAAWTGMVNGILMAAMLSAVFLAARDWIAGLFLDVTDPANLPAFELATSIMVVVAVYQLVNAPQLVTTSALRGLRDTTIPFLISLSGYWLLGSVFAGILGFGLDYQAVGIWAGLAGAVCISGVLLVRRLTRLLPQAMALTEDES